MSINTLEEFLNEIFKRFPLEEKREYSVEQQIEDYSRQLNNGKKYNYDVALSNIISNYKYRKTPYIATIKEYLKECEIKDINYYNSSNYANFETLIAQKGNNIYEFGIETNYAETKKALERQGFTNIRLKFMPKSQIKLG